MSQAGDLATSTRYTPFASGEYAVSPSLTPLTRSFGNGETDQRVFQIDEAFASFRANVLRARAENFSKYCGCLEGHEIEIRAAVEFVQNQLADEHPGKFSLQSEEGVTRLDCALTHECLSFDANGVLLDSQGQPYDSAWDALASQVQEDFALVKVGDDRDVVVAIHVTAPGYWDPAAVLGTSFGDIHGPVPGMEKIVGRSRTLLSAMTQKARFQRFVWGLATDTRLNHHPHCPDDLHISPTEWYGRRFHAEDGELVVRVERQVIVGLPEVSAFLFLIHPYFLDCADLEQEERSALVSALHSMSEATREYKGLADDFETIVARIERG